MTWTEINGSTTGITSFSNIPKILLNDNGVGTAIPSTGFWLTSFSNTVFADTAFFSNTATKITVLVEGMYYIAATVGFPAGPPCNLLSKINVEVDNTLINSNLVIRSDATVSVTGGNIMYPLHAGNIVDFAVFQDSGKSVTTSAGYGSILMAYLGVVTDPFPTLA